MAIVTTSWDDGHPLDVRVAEILHKTRMKGTFYVPLSNPEAQTLPLPEVRRLHEQFEVGAHTATHVRLPRLSTPRLWEEIAVARDRLQDDLGAAVTSFCYPGGKFSRRVRSVVRDAGFALARTTCAFLMGSAVDPLALPVTVQAYPHSTAGHVRHALVEKNVRGAIHYISWGLWGLDWVHLALRSLDRVVQRGGWWHLWGHSWEIEALGAWDVLETVLAAAGSSGAQAMTNGELVQGWDRTQ